MKNSKFLKNLTIIIKKNYPERFALIFFAGSIVALLEILSLGTIPLFVGFILSPEVFIERVPFENLKIYFTNLQNTQNLIFHVTGLVLFAFLIKNLFLSMLLYFEFKTIHQITRDINSKIYNHYVYVPYELTLDINPSHLSRNIILEIRNAITILVLGLNFVREIFVIIAIFILLILEAPTSTILIILLLFVVSSIFYFSVRKTLVNKAKENIAIREKLIRIVNETFGSLKNLKILLMEKLAINSFKREVSFHEKNLFFIYFVNRLPRILLETVSIILLVSIVFYFIYFGEDTSQIFPSISLLAIAIIRLVPAFNAVAVGLNNFKAKGPSLDLVAKEIIKIEKFKDYEISNYKDLDKDKISENFDSIELKNINYKYPKSETEILKNLSMKIKYGEFIGILGETGSGKSTLVNLMLGLLKPQRGTIHFNQKDIFNNIYKWRKFVGYVSQDIFLNDDSIKNNITFSNFGDEINQSNFDDAIKFSKLENFISKLSEGLETKVGRDGIKLSGGQKQRISIARALYRKPQILFLDEATSALDVDTENQVINNIKSCYENSGTIIMVSHKSKSLEKCDCIYRVKDGNIKKIN